MNVKVAFLDGNLPVTGGTAVEESGVGIVHDLVESEAHIVGAGCERRIRRLVAKLEFRGFRDGVVVGVPDEVDGVTDGSVDGERNVAKNTLGRCNNDSVGNTIAGGARAAAIGCH